MAGEAAVLAPIADAIAAQLDDDEMQLGLFSAPASEVGQALTELALRGETRGSDAGKAALVLVAGRRGAGRPPGARNKRTEATIAHLLGRYRDPRAIALERIQMHPADLAAALGCSISEAEDKQRLWAVAVMPFLHARITPEVIDNRQVIHLHLGGLGEGAMPASGGAIRVLEASEFATVADGSSAATDDISET